MLRCWGDGNLGGYAFSSAVVLNLRQIIGMKMHVSWWCVSLLYIATWFLCFWNVTIIVVLCSPIQYRAYVVRRGPGGPQLGFRLCDTMGMEESQGISVMDFPHILAGHVPNGYQVVISVFLLNYSKLASLVGANTFQIATFLWIITGSSRWNVLPVLLFE